ncbi:MAG TPA: hypothetical protein VF649_14110 [Sphingomonas sp.]
MNKITFSRDDSDSDRPSNHDSLLLGLVTVTGLSLALWTSLITAVVLLA